MLTSAPGAVTARRAAEPRRSAAATAGIRAGLHRELNSRRARLRASGAERDEAQRAHSSDPSAFTRMEVDFWSADVSRNAMAVQDVERALAVRTRRTSEYVVAAAAPCQSIGSSRRPIQPRALPARATDQAPPVGSSRQSRDNAEARDGLNGFMPRWSPVCVA
jgi:hypothetical protein